MTKFELGEMIANAKNPKAGETWHIRLPGATTLSTWLVTDVTALTVEISEDRYGRKTRYKRSDVDLVEKAVK